MAKLCTVHEVLVDGRGEGPAGDGTFINRFRKLPDAQAFAKGKTTYGKPASVSTVEVTRKLAQRWGVA